MRTRLDLADVQLEEATRVGEGGGYAQQAEATLRIVLDWTRGAVKGIERRRKERGGGREAGSAAGTDEGVSLSSNSRQGGDTTGWESDLRAIRRRVLGMSIQVEEVSGRTARIEGLRKQLAEEESMQSGS